MGNMHCPAEDAAHLADIARDFCPFPDYNPNPHFIHMLSLNSSLHLKNHYDAVQSSLTPQQLQDFTHSLRTTFGRDGKVTLGGVGVVAFSLAVLFDTLARQVKGECVTESEPIPGVFLKDLRGHYLPPIYTISKYLRLVPHIANNPSRMIEETDRYMRQIMKEDETLLDKYKNLSEVQDITVINLSLVHVFAASLNIHLMRIQNGTEKVQLHKYDKEVEFVFNLNCDAEAASDAFVAEMPNFDNRTQEAFKKCNPQKKHKTVIHNIASMTWLDMSWLVFLPVTSFDELVAQREDFDLKANALGKW